MKRIPIFPVALALVPALAASACGGVELVNQEKPSNVGGPQVVGRGHAHAHENERLAELPDNEAVVEPDHPMVGTREERALVHVHTPEAVCSGVVIGPRLVATAHQCVKKARNAAVVPADQEVKVELASSTLTWTNRKVSIVVAPNCSWKHLDLAILILSEPAEWVEPAKVAMAPGIGASISALGFGRCAGEAVRAKGRPGSVVAIESEAITIDVPLCKGDVGGPIVDGNGGALVGLISHRDDPEGSPRKTTTAFRLDTTGARSLVQIATDVAKGLDPAKVGPIGCD